MSVTLTEAPASAEPLLQNMMQLYAHDFSEYWADTDRGDLGPDGRFGDYPMADYWKLPGWTPLLIHSGSVLAGFALINDHAHAGAPVNRSVAEFFVLRKHRSRGVGKIAALMVFDRDPGSWEVAIARKNVKAGGFWRRTIRESGKASGLTESDVNDGHWNGPILRFDWKA